MIYSPSQSLPTVLDSRWMSHLKDKSDRENFEKTLRHDTIILGRLLVLLDEMAASIDATELRSDQFENPNWAYKQAYLNGDRARLQKVRDLLKFIQGD